MDGGGGSVVIDSTRGEKRTVPRIRTSLYKSGVIYI